MNKLLGYCPNGEACPAHACIAPGCLKERLREQGYAVKDGAVVFVGPIKGGSDSIPVPTY